MATDFQTAEAEPGVATLVGGIMQDARQLMAQQLTLFQTEIKNDLQRAILAIAPMIIGAVICVPAFLLLGMSGAYFLCWIIEGLPTWGGFAIAGGAVGLIGIVLIFSGQMLLKRVHFVPEQSIEGLKENLQWKTKN